MKKILLLSLISFNLFAGTMPNNDYKVGKGSSTEDKGFTFNTGDGVSNPTLKANDLKTLIYSDNKVQIGDGASVNDKEIIIDPTSGASLKWEGSDNYVELRNNNVRIGRGIDEDVIYEYDIGLGATNPKIKWDSVKGKFRQSIDGSDKDLGSGSGGGGGDNFNNGFSSDDNANAEDGTTGWTASAGTFSVDSSDPIEGDNSFTWIPSAQNDTLDSPVLNFDRDVFKGNSCQASIEYIGGDENLTLQVINGNNEVLGSEVLKPHSVFSQESVFFFCPNQTQITGDSEKGNLRYRILNEGAVASQLIKFDKSYLGTLKGLSESVLPDSFSVSVDSDGTVISESSDWIDGNCSKPSTGNYICSYNSLGLTEPMSCVGSTNRGNINRYIDVNTSSLTQVSIVTTTPQAASNFDMTADEKFSIHCQKQGLDAKKSISVYKPVPKVSQNINKFGADLTGSTGTINDQNVNWIQSIVSGGTGSYNVTYVAGTFDSTPFCQITPLNSGAVFQVSYTSSNSTGITLKVRDSSGSNVDSRVVLNCVRGSDIKTGLTQNISLHGIAVNSYAEKSQSQVRIEGCQVQVSGGTPSTFNSICDDWIDSLTDNGVGDYTLNIVNSIFNEHPSCSVSSEVVSDQARIATIRSLSASSIRIQIRNNSETSVDQDFHINCIGVK